MRILHINQQDSHGGAANIANCLVEKLNNHKIQSELWYFNKKGEDVKYSKCIYPILEQYRKNIFINKVLEKLVRYHTLYRGDVRNPFFSGIVKRIYAWNPDIIHLHNLHGGWVDLKSIAKLSQQFQIIITLHDEWLMTGHCGVSMDCTGWQNGCITCPYLFRYVPLKRAITKKLREIKSRFLSVLAKNNALLVTPSEYHKNRFIKSGVWNGQDIVVIPNGIDVSIFSYTQTEKSSLRKELNLPLEGKIAFFIADGGAGNIWKGFSSLRTAIELLPKGKNLTVVVAGDTIKNRESEKIKDVVLIKVGYLSREILPKYYGAADVFLYPTNADSFGLVILEAMASGAPIITTNAGAIPDLISDKETGVLVPKERPDLLMYALLDFMENKYDYKSMGLKAKEKAVSFYSSERMVLNYISLYTRCKI